METYKFTQEEIDQSTDFSNKSNISLYGARNMSSEKKRRNDIKIR
jgi:hypothetical protein